MKMYLGFSKTCRKQVFFQEILSEHGRMWRVIINSCSEHHLQKSFTNLSTLSHFVNISSRFYLLCEKLPNKIINVLLVVFMIIIQIQFIVRLFIHGWNRNLPRVVYFFLLYSFSKFIAA